MLFAMLVIKISNNGRLINFYVICMTYRLRKAVQYKS